MFIHSLQIKLEILRVGAIPIKSSRGDPITWFSCSGTIETNRLNNFLENGGNTKITPKSENDKSDKSTKPKDKKIVPITLKIKENQGLGCIICRGPQETLGIIVQKLKPEGVAIESGLSPGDQILQCNGVSLEGVSFQDAVYQLKSSRQLDLIVKKGVAIKFVNEKNSQTTNRINTQNDMNVLDGSNEKEFRQEESAKLQTEKLKLEQTKIELDRKKLELTKIINDNERIDN